MLLILWRQIIPWGNYRVEKLSFSTFNLFSCIQMSATNEKPSECVRAYPHYNSLHWDYEEDTKRKALTAREIREAVWGWDSRLPVCVCVHLKHVLTFPQSFSCPAPQKCIWCHTMQTLPPGFMHMQGHGQVATAFSNFSQPLSRLLLGFFGC